MTEDGLDETIGIQLWTEELHRDGLASDPEFVLLADTELRAWAKHHPGFALETIATAFWPPEDDASALEVEERVLTNIPKLTGALLPQLGALARRELEQTNDLPGWVERMRPTLPHKSREADERHPANPATITATGPAECALGI